MMRFILAICIMCVSQAFALNSLSQNARLSLSHTNSTIRRVLQDIEDKTDYYFMYNSRFVDVEKVVTIKVEGRQITEVLSQLFNGTGIEYKVEDRQIALIPEAGSMVQTQQERPVSGKVTGSDGYPIPGATVIVKGTTIGTIADADGSFSLRNVPADAILVVSFVGMRPQEIAISNQRVLNVSLQEETIGLEEVVAIGYGVQKKKLVTGSTVQVAGEDMQKLSTVNALTALQSQAPGVNIVQSSGLPGEGYKVTIRGLGTKGHSSPLYVIDGITGGSINNLNPSDIESIDVLKDAASAAIYGSRAANGVILITTRQGKANKRIQVTYDAYVGVQNPWKIAPLLNAKEYMTILDEKNFNDGMDPHDWENLIPGLYEKIQNGWQGTNWLKESRNKNAITQNHAINLTGGSELSKFSLGFSYTDQEGIFGKPVNPDYQRYTARLNSEHILLQKNGIDIIKFGENLNFNYRENTGIGIGNMYWNDIHNILVANPLMPVYNDSGEYWDADDNASSGIRQIDTYATNPIAEMVYRRGQNLSKNYALNINAYIEIQPIQSLIFKSIYGYKMSASSYRAYTPVYNLSTTGYNTIDRVTQNMSSGHDWSLENTLAYSFRLQQHSFNALAGLSLEKWGMGEDSNITNANSLFDDFDHAWLSNTQGYTAGTTIISGSPWGEGSMVSLFGRVLYDYRETYMLSAILRADGSSNFARNHRWGYFPSFSAGWVMTNETFMTPWQSWLDFLKIRGGWGQNGNCNIDNFQYLATIAFGDSNKYSFGNSKTSQTTGGFADILPNPTVTWETSEQLSIGFDARLFASKLAVTFDWYKKTTVDWLVQAPILASYGTGAPFINGGDVENKGIEIALGWNDRIGDFKYGINLNLAKNKNIVTRLLNDEGIIHGPIDVLSQSTSEMYRVEVGKPIGYFWGYKTNGVFQNYEQISKTPAIKQVSPQPGDLIFADTDGDNSITDADKCEIGNPHPDVTMGLGLNFEYKGFDLSITATGAFGQQIAKSYRSTADSKYQNHTTDIFGRWHGEGTSNRLPRLTDGGNVNWKEISDIFIEDGDYVKIQNITLGYDFKKLLPRIPLSMARLYVTGQNVFTFTGYSGMDPEIGYGYDESWVSGIDLGFYPSPRTYLIGINVKF